MSLDAVVDRALERAADYSIRFSGKPEPDEVAQVIGLFRRGLPWLYRGLVDELSSLGFDVAVGGVFCHRRPIVYFDPNGDCELGDLLVLVRRRGAQRRESRALLLQAKTPTTRIPADHFLMPRCAIDGATARPI